MPAAPFCQDGHAHFDCGIAEPVTLALLAMGASRLSSATPSSRSAADSQGQFRHTMAPKAPVTPARHQRRYRVDEASMPRLQHRANNRSDSEICVRNGCSRESR